MTRLVDAVRQANRPGPAEDSVVLRVSSAGAVVTGILAAAAQHELVPTLAAIAMVAVVAGNVFSYWRRRRPLPWLKLLLGAVMVGAFGWFFLAVSSEARAGSLGSVEAPLAALFTAMQVAHAFDVPARRDLGFSLAGSATLMAVAAAQAVTIGFGVFVVVWGAFLMAGLTSQWGSMAGGARPRAAGVAAAVVVVVAVAAVLLAVLPAPRPASGLVTPASLGGGSGSEEPTRAVGSGHPPPQRAASPAGPTGVGGFLGFAGPLDTAVRGTLGTRVVLRVRASVPSFWVAETYETWTGQSWVEPTTGRHWRYRELSGGPPFGLARGAGGPLDGTPAAGAGTGAGGPGAAAATSAAQADYQTFYLATGSDLVLHAAQPEVVWYPSPRLYVSPDGTIKSSTYLGPGSVYTVLSSLRRPADTQLAAVRGTAGLAKATRAAALQLPHPYPRVRALAERVAGGRAGTYAKVTALEAWLGRHTRYTTDIPPLARGQDTVTQFLFHTRRGYCEQISTALAVMLRSMGIPVRETTGYVPGTYDPITGLYEVRAKDAHAWVQVWFPGYGWQSFDPTADVPLAKPSTASALGHYLLASLQRLPVVPTVPVVAAVAAVLAAVWVRRRRPPHWRAAVSAEIERAAARAGVAGGPSSTLATTASALDEALGAALGGRAPVGAARVAQAAERAAWRGTEPDAATRRTLVRDARRLRRASRRPRARRGPRRTTPRRRGAAGTPSAGGDG